MKEEEIVERNMFCTTLNLEKLKTTFPNTASFLKEFTPFFCKSKAISQKQDSHIVLTTQKNFKSVYTTLKLHL